MNRLFGSAQRISEIHKGVVKIFVGKGLDFVEDREDRNALEFDFRGKFSSISGQTVTMLIEDAIELRNRLNSLDLENMKNE